EHTVHTRGVESSNLPSAMSDRKDVAVCSILFSYSPGQWAGWTFIQQVFDCFAETSAVFVKNFFILGRWFDRHFHPGRL
ncbi:hypothetical protein, partial [Murimonas intestini]|uniref:hypothetical protein n=1 Tax=Murimonas intestini TaxID=1337051 RepID=UPI00248BB37B